MAIEHPYFYDKQIKKYLLQTMAVFSGLTIYHDDKQIDVPVQYGSKDRVAAWINSGGTQNKALRLPMISCHLKSIKLSPERMKGTNTERKTVFMPAGGVVPNDLKVIHQLMPVPYNISVDVTIYTANMDSMLQILEQIAVIFNPTLQIQTSDGPFDWQKITVVELKDIAYGETYPIGASRRFERATLSFDVPIYIGVPANIKNDIVEKIKIIVSNIDDNTILSDTFEIESPTI